MELDAVAARVGADIGTATEDGSGWRWRGTWRGVRIAAWNDMDGVAIVADVGPFDGWVGLAGHPPDPTAEEALEWVVATLSDWIEQPGNSERVRRRSAS